MKGNYSPFNKSFKFICLQNQLAHAKNKRSVKSKGQSNISLLSSPSKTTQHHSSIDPYFSSSKQNRHFESNQSFCFLEPYRVVHKNLPQERKRKTIQLYQNKRLAEVLCNATCEIITKNQAEKDYEEHLGFKEIATKYSGRYPKDLVRPTSSSFTDLQVQKYKNSEHLCTLAHSSNRKQTSKKQSKTQRKI